MQLTNLHIMPLSLYSWQLVKVTLEHKVGRGELLHTLWELTALNFNCQGFLLPGSLNPALFTVTGPGPMPEPHLYGR